MSLTPLNIKSVRDADVKGKRVLVRVDFNVPIENGAVVDDGRIKAALPTIKLLLDGGAAKIILLAHMGRPGGKVVEGLRMEPVRAHLKTFIDAPEIELLENLRFDPGEKANDPMFAKKLAALGDIFVNEAFADSHRAHASIAHIPQLLPSYAGLNMLEEIHHLEQALTPPPGSVAIIGGAKFETKIPLLTKLSALYGAVLLGGALANDMLKSRGSPVGSSLISKTPMPEELAGNERIVIPTDVILAGEGDGVGRTTVANDIRAQERMMDIGPVTAALWSEKIASAPFVVWNGPMGVYEKHFMEGTDALAEAIALRSNSGRLPQEFHAVIGGGDTLAAIKKFSFDPARVFLSTGGGAMLQFLADGTLPGIEALKNSKS